MPTMSDSPLRPHLRDPRVAAIRRALTRRASGGPADAADEAIEPHADGRIIPAGVALVVRPRPEDLEVLLIHRAAFPGDPWSGHVALPGGRFAPTDRDVMETAVRETREEVGIDLTAHGLHLGRLDRVMPRAGAPAVSVTPSVFAVPPDIEVTPNYEVQAAFWVPAGHLDDPASAVEHSHTFASGETLNFPGIGYGDLVIWGLTHRILRQFFELTRSVERGRRP